MDYVNTVLVVDDADLVREMLGFMLTKAGYNTLPGADGDDALTFFDGRNIDLVVTDLNMPGMDGLELINKIRSKEDYQYTPIVLFVADDANDKNHYSNIPGVTAIFDKKNIKDKFLPTVRKMIG